jgi:hypothetical protein
MLVLCGKHRASPPYFNVRDFCKYHTEAYGTAVINNNKVRQTYCLTHSYDVKAFNSY